MAFLVGIFQRVMEGTRRTRGKLVLFSFLKWVLSFEASLCLPDSFGALLKRAGRVPLVGRHDGMALWGPPGITEVLAAEGRGVGSDLSFSMTRWLISAGGLFQGDSALSSQLFLVVLLVVSVTSESNLVKCDQKCSPSRTCC